MPKRFKETAPAPASDPTPPVSRVGPSLITPSILREVFLHCSRPSLSSCMQVNQTFYSAAAPILYREFTFPCTPIQKVGIGYDITTNTRTTRARKPKTNLKKDLLGLIKVVQLEAHENCVWHLYEFHTPVRDIIRCIPRFETLRLVFDAWCSCAEGVHCEICRSDTELWGHDIVHCPWLKGLRAKNVVLTSIRAHNADAVLTALSMIISEADTATLVISPDVKSCGRDLGTIINENLASLGGKPPQLRIIFSDLGLEISKLTYREHLYCDIHLSHSSVAPTRALARCVIRSASSRWTATAYFIEGCFKYPRTRHGKQWKLPSMAKIEQAMEECLTGDDYDRPLVHLKSRADYLREGWIDEMDPKEVAQWQEAQDKANEHKRCDQFRKIIVEERNQHKTAKEAEEPDLLDSVVFNQWMEDWAEQPEYGIRVQRHVYDCRVLETHEDDMLLEEVGDYELYVDHLEREAKKNRDREMRREEKEAQRSTFRMWDDLADDDLLLFWSAADQAQPEGECDDDRKDEGTKDFGWDWFDRPFSIW